ncbi:hypothetical protein RQP46_000048 [Phenoliferia psychrophenolica]
MADLAAKFPLAHPDFHPFLGFFPGFDITVHPAEGIRPFTAAFPPPPMPDPAVASVESIEIPGKAGQAPLRLLVVRPVGTKKVPVVLGIHGGGFLMGAPEMDIALYGHFAAAGFAVVSPDYRLAPEHPYPAAYDDCELAYNYIVSDEGQKAHNIDGTRVAAWGSSAGSALATGLAIRLNQKSAGKALKVVLMDSSVADQRIIYPSQAPNHPNAIYHSVWTAKNSEAMYSYTFGNVDVKSLPIEASPLLSTNDADFKGLAPHVVTSCELDSLADMGSIYADRLKGAGVDVAYRMFKGGPHAYLTLVPTSALAVESMAYYEAALVKYLA